MKTKPRATPRRAKATVSKHVPLAPPSEYPTQVGRVLINDQRRVGLVTADCAAWTRMLRIGDGGVDVVRMLPDTLTSEGWKPLECERAAFKLANTLARSPMAKSPNAVRAIEAAQASVPFADMKLDDMAAEYNRLAVDAPRCFKRRIDVERALRKAMEICNATQPTNEGDIMAATKKAAKGKTKAKPVKKAAAPKTKTKKLATTKAKKGTGAPRGGIGAMARELIAKGKDNAEIVDAIKLKFPGCNTNAACISWYRGKMKKEA